MDKLEPEKVKSYLRQMIDLMEVKEKDNEPVFMSCYMYSSVLADALALIEEQEEKIKSLCFALGIHLGHEEKTIFSIDDKPWEVKQ